MIIDVLGSEEDALGQVVTFVPDSEKNEEKAKETLPSPEPQLEIVKIRKEKSSEKLPPEEIQKILEEL